MEMATRSVKEELLHTPFSYQFVHQETQLTPKPLPPITQHMIEALLTNHFHTKTALAKELGVSLVTINRWINGSIRKPAHATFARLLQLYCASQIIARSPTQVEPNEIAKEAA